MNNFGAFEIEKIYSIEQSILKLSDWKHLERAKDYARQKSITSALSYSDLLHQEYIKLCK